MGRIPIYASKAPLRRTPMVRPQPDIAVSEAIGGLAETVGAITADWATKKAEVEAESEYANNTVLYKQAIGNNYKVQSEDASIDPDDLVPNYKKSMQESSGSLIWKSKEAQKQFELNKGNFDLAAEQRLNSLGRSRFIANTKAGYETSRKISIENRDKSGGLLALKATQGAFTPDQYKAEKTDLVHDIEMVQAQDALIVNIKADLSEFKALSTADKAKVIKLVQTERKRLKQVADDALGEEREQTEKAFTEKWVNNELTTAEVLASNLTGKRQQAYIKLIGADSAGSKAVNDIPIEAELLRRANTKEGTYQKFVDDVSEAVKEKTLTTAKAGTLLNKWFTKDKDAAYDKAEDVIYGGNITLDFPTRDKIWIDFNAIIDAEPDKYRGMAGYDLAVKMTDEAVEQNRSRFWEFFTASPISLLTNRLTKPQVRKPVAEKVKRDEEAKEEVTDYSKYWE